MARDPAAVAPAAAAPTQTPGIVDDEIQRWNDYYQQNQA